MADNDPITAVKSQTQLIKAKPARAGDAKQEVSRT